MVQAAPIQETASPKKSTPAWVTIHGNWKHRAYCRTCRQLSQWGPFGWLEPLPDCSPGLKVSFSSPYSFYMVEKERPNVWAVVGTSWSLWVISWAQERIFRMECSPLRTPRDSHTFSNPLSIIQTLLIEYLELPPKHKVFVPEKSATQQSALLGGPHGPPNTVHTSTINTALHRLRQIMLNYGDSSMVTKQLCPQWSHPGSSPFNQLCIS